MTGQQADRNCRGAPGASGARVAGGAPLSRRDFLARAAGLGGTLALGAHILAACRGTAGCPGRFSLSEAEFRHSAIWTTTKIIADGLTL